MVDDVLEHQQSHLAMVSTVLGSTADLVDNVITTTRTHLASEAAAAERSKALAHQTAAAEIRRLRAQNDMLTRMLSSEKAKTAKLRTELVQNLTNMIVGFTDAQDASWTQAVEGVKMANEEGMGEMERYGDLVEEEWEEKVGRAEIVEKELQSAQGSSKRQRVDGQHVSPSCDRILMVGPWRGYYWCTKSIGTVWSTYQGRSFGTCGTSRWILSTSR